MKITTNFQGDDRRHWSVILEVSVVANHYYITNYYLLLRILKCFKIRRDIVFQNYKKKIYIYINQRRHEEEST